MTDNETPSTNETTHHNLKVIPLQSKMRPSVSAFAVNLIEPGKANWFREHINEMTASVLRQNYVDYENKLASFELGQLPLTQSDRMEIVEILSVLSGRLDEIIPQMAMDIVEHDVTTGRRSAENWPDDLPKHTLMIHLHLCELIDSWNINPHRRLESQGVATIDQFAETLGITRFAFTSKEGREDFLEFYGLEDFEVERIDAREPREASDGGGIIPGDPYWYIRLSNKFAKEDVQTFLDVYRSALNTLAALNEERARAIRHDGGRVGFTCIEHFTIQELHELTRIRQAREQLGAPAK